MNTRLLSFFALAVLLFASRVDAQYAALPKPVNPGLREGHTVVSVAKGQNQTVAGLGSNALPESIAIPGCYSMGMESKYQTQTDGRSLHNIQVDPSNPQNIHAVIMNAPNASTADTSGNNLGGGQYLTRNCFYTFSSNGGTSWSTPKAISKYRSGFPDMILYKNSSNNWVPIIACHQYVTSTSSDTLVCGLYIETGAPGAGNFVEAVTDRNYPDGTTQNIIWPRIAISSDNSTVYVAGSVSPNPTTNPLMNIAVGTFTIGEGTSVKWNGWNYGPVNDSTSQLGTATGSQGHTSGAEYQLAVSPQGKIGLSWINGDFATPDLGVYFAESPDGMKTWNSTFSPLWNTTDSSLTPTGSTITYYLRPTNGLDMFYNGEQIRLLTGVDFESENASSNSYIPNSGGIMMWNGDPNTPPSSLLSRTLLTSVDTGAFLSLWQGTVSGSPSVDPQMPIVVYPTFAQSTNVNRYSVFFECWVNNDSEIVNDTLAYPYHSIYEKHTTDDGATWSDAAPVMTNSGSGLKFDYRYPQTSTYNASDFNNMKYGLAFMADTGAGLWSLPGYPVWDSVDWYFHTTAGIPFGAVSAQQPNTFTVSQNYPNPFVTSTSIAFKLKSASIVNVTVTDVLGRTVSTLIDAKELAGGAHSAKFDASTLPNGVYFYTIRANGEAFTQRMLLAK
jgi:hypothetical protein